VNYAWHSLVFDDRFWYLRDTDTGEPLAKLYFMYGRWNISVKVRANEASIRSLCEQKMVELVCKRLEEP